MATGTSEAIIRIDRNPALFTMPPRTEDPATNWNNLASAIMELSYRMNRMAQTLKVIVEGQDGTGGLVNQTVLTACPSINGTSTIDFPAINLLTGATSTCTLPLTDCT